MQLGAAFRDELAATSAAAAYADTPDLESRLAALVARGRAAHPELSVEGPRFVRHLARCVVPADDGATPILEQLAIEDLYLACACAFNLPGAAAAFDVRCAGRIKAVLATTARSSDLRAEAEQRVREVLLVGTAQASAKIAGYRGQGELDKWVAVVTQRQVITLLRAGESEQRAREAAGLEAAVVTGGGPELAYAKQRYGAEFERAMAEALTSLGERERLLLRLHLVRGVPVDCIGKMYGVSQSTASRWLAQAREAVSAEVERQLRDRLDLSRGEIASLAGLVASQLDLSMSRLLKTRQN